MRPWLRRTFYGGAVLGWALLLWDIASAGFRGLPLARFQAVLATLACFVMAGEAVKRAIGKTDD